MTEEKESAENVDFRGKKSESESPKTTKTTKLRIGIISGLALLAAACVVFVVLFLLKESEVPKSLVEINLDEGDTLMYHVNQSFDISGQNEEKETIKSTVGLRVANKTEDGYWFLVKIKTAFKDKDDKVKADVIGYYRVQLQLNGGSKDSNQTIETFQVFGPPKTDKKFIRFLHGILYQILPSVRRDLYEDVDGQTDGNLKSENSPLFPGPVRMHRQANTKQSDQVSIKNHFNRSDFVNSSSDVDLEVKYTDSASLNKSNGMVSESNASLYEQLNFGRPMKAKNGDDVTMMNVTICSHVTRIEMDDAFFKKEEIEDIEGHLFVKLAIATEEKKIKIKYGTRANSTSFHEKRHRRSITAMNKLRRYLAGNFKVPYIHHSFTLFDKRIIGIDVKGMAKMWLSHQANGFQIGAGLSLEIGSIHTPIYGVAFSDNDVENARQKENSAGIHVPWCINIFWMRFCIQFDLSPYFKVKSQMINGETSLTPLKAAFEVKPYAEVKATVSAYASIYVLRGGIAVDGTIVRGSIPTKLSFSEVKSANQRWCIDTNAQLTILEINAELFYQWKNCQWQWHGWHPWLHCYWGQRQTLMSFWRWSLWQKNWNLFYACR